MLTLPSAYALVIGIADHPRINNLPQTAIKDSRDIQDLLIDPQH
jgi:hypothetical protein